FYSETILRKVLKRPIIVSIGGLIIATSFLLLAFVTPFEFFPAADKVEVIMDVRLDTDIAVDETDKKSYYIVDCVLNVDNCVKESDVFAGDGLPRLFVACMDNTGNNTGQAVFRINKDQTSASEFIEKWESKLRSEYGDAEIFLDTIVQGPPVGAPVTITVSGE